MGGGQSPQLPARPQLCAHGERGGGLGKRRTAASWCCCCKLPTDPLSSHPLLLVDRFSHALCPWLQDVKASNVLLTCGGQAKLGDVGLARLQTKTCLSDLPRLVGTFACG